MLRHHGEDTIVCLLLQPLTIFKGCIISEPMGVWIQEWLIWWEIWLKGCTEVLPQWWWRVMCRVFYCRVHKQEFFQARLANPNISRSPAQSLKQWKAPGTKWEMIEGDVSVFKEKPEVGNFPHFPNFYICAINSSNISYKLTSQRYVISDLGVHSSQ